MATKTSPLLLGCAVRFRDQWTGRLAAIEIDESWEILNAVVRRGLFRATTVRLPFEAATGFGEGFLAFDEMTSAAAFGREVPPVAAPSRPISEETPIAPGGPRLAGLLVDNATRTGTDVLVRRGRTWSHVAVSGVAFEGKVLHLGIQAEGLVPYYTDDELEARVREALAHSRALTTAELQSLRGTVSGGAARLSGNVRTKQAREEAAAAAASALGVRVDSRDVTDDPSLELAIGRALEQAGLSRQSQIFVRSTLGDVSLYGHAPSQAAVDEVLRVAGKTTGVRRTVNRIEIPAAAAAAR